MARDPKRIPYLIKMLEELWRKHPDMRLGQLVWAIRSNIGPHDADVFYIEDDEMQESMEDMLGYWSGVIQNAPERPGEAAGGGTP